MLSTQPSPKTKRPRNIEAKHGNRDWRAGHALEYWARGVADRAQKAGILVKQPCRVCGCLEVEKHHVSHFFPLVVRWLCRLHHVQADKELRDAVAEYGAKQRQPRLWE